MHLPALDKRQNEMDIDRALQLYRELNPSSDSDNERLLRIAYDRYLDQFQEFMQMAVDNDENDTLEGIVEKVLQMTREIQFKEWGENIKLNQLPAMLAGLAAVWSILVSKDVSGTGKYLSPHCIQVICLLRLLSADRVELGVAKHLAQVLTGQGKSLILALCAALLAFMGHDVLVVCYNRYLLERDAADFKQLFSIFGVAERIQYGTFEDLANSVLTSSVDGQRIGLREMVTDLISQDEMNHKATAKVKSKHNMVLLMDEVDVFFTNEFYGNDYYPVANPMITGLGRIQQEIWKAVSEKCYDLKVLTTRIMKYIKSFVNYEVFEEFLAASNRYNLLVHQNVSDIFGVEKPTWKLKSYTNRTLFDEHLQCMLQCAIEVHREPKSRWANYQLSPRNTIAFKYLGEYTNHRRESYYNTFNYFRLKKGDFCSEINGELNYGYLNIDCGSLSYAMLPKSFALILGVSGTLTTLSEPQQKTIKELYDIGQKSVLPTFFGCSNLCYDASGDFYHLPTAGDWMECICSHTQEVVASKRAVITFFSTEEELHKFKCNYSGRFDRLNVLTENTEKTIKRQYINEAGIPRTVTLATRGMGRGVDYKSSVAVERNGGVHVIQTFFSLDIREETQIRGRTARKDNKGCYELVVCDSDLKNSALLTKDEQISYDKLNENRAKLLLEGNGKTYKAIKQASAKHEITMTYLQSLFD
ncbi:protein translocase subunit SecA-like [Sabethes cyaneus]|uniref:protein translocase subunit SecA-like n=1 Tax=Sabethes cyaneus TaxID=53552 RepID=UPI00237E9F86|nr:protein translocase subunit SecA-like [Sabethes cyaneus]